MIKKGKIKFKAVRIFTRVVFLIGIAIFVLLGSSLANEYYRGYQIQKEIDSLKKDIDFLEKNNYNLSQLVEYFKTDEYKQLAVRERWNVGKEDEKLAVILKSQTENSASVSFEEKTGIDDEGLPNYQKWWNYFFAERKN